MLWSKLYSDFWQPVRQRVVARIRNIRLAPPELPLEYTQADFARFMREETFCYSKRYARKFVVIHGGEHLTAATQQGGAILACLHYGSFFLSGGAIAHQLKLPYTAVVTSRNFQVLSEQEAAFWRGVHHRAEKLYGRRLFSTGESSRTLLKWLKPTGRLLGVVLDVREYGQKLKEHPFVFLGHPIFMQSGPARLACLANVPMVPMTIQYNRAEQRHHLYFDAPIPPRDDPVGMTQQALAALEKHVAAAPQQQFQDIVTGFAAPHSV